MPELPEVETIKNNLRQGTLDQPPVIGRKILGAQVLWPRTVAILSPDEFQLRITGQVILDVGRRGKYLVFYLSDDAMLIHLRMSGDMMVEPETAHVLSHHRIILDLESGLRLAFNDPRKFGRVWLVNDPALILGGLGPEPLNPLLTPEIFMVMLQASRRSIKPLLLDQGFLAGLGNIYADEALHLARLHPLIIANSLNHEQSDRLLWSIRQVLEEGIRRNGASIDWVYRGGDFQNYFRAYHRTGQPCPVCKSSIERMIVGQRSTHYCPQCQVLPNEKPCDQ